MIFGVSKSNLFCEVAGTIRRVKNFIVKDREVQSKSEPNWMSWRQFGICNVLHSKGTRSSVKTTERNTVMNEKP